MTDTDEIKNYERDKLLEYIRLLEKTNTELLETLKQCVFLLSQFTEAVPDSDGFKRVIDNVNNIIKAGESVVAKKTMQ